MSSSVLPTRARLAIKAASAAPGSKRTKAKLAGRAGSSYLGVKAFSAAPGSKRTKARLVGRGVGRSAASSDTLLTAQRVALLAVGLAWAYAAEA